MKNYAISIITTKANKVKYSISGHVTATSPFQALLKFVKEIKIQSPNASLLKVHYII